MISAQGNCGANETTDCNGSTIKGGFECACKDTIIEFNKNIFTDGKIGYVEFDFYRIDK